MGHGTILFVYLTVVEFQQSVVFEEFIYFFVKFECKVFVMFSYPFDGSRVCCDAPCFIPDINNLCLISWGFLPILLEFYQFHLFIFFQRTGSWYYWLCRFSVSVSVSGISVLSVLSFFLSFISFFVLALAVSAYFSFIFYSLLFKLLNLNEATETICFTCSHGTKLWPRFTWEI